MTPAEVCQVIEEMMALSERSDAEGQGSLHGAFIACAMVLVDAAEEDGVAVDRDCLGFMSGVIEG